MMQHEFEERVNFRVSAHCYETMIEPEYYGTETLKDEWCKQWKRNGGIQKAYNFESDEKARKTAEAERLNDKLKAQEHKFSLLNNELQDITTQLDGCRSELGTTRNKLNTIVKQLINIADATSSTELRSLVIEEIGFKAYITYKIENNLSIWDIDKQDIINNLK